MERDPVAGYVSRVDVSALVVRGGSREHLLERLGRLKAVSRRSRHPPRRDLLRAKLRQRALRPSGSGAVLRGARQLALL